MNKYVVPEGLKKAICEGFKNTKNGEFIYETIGLAVVKWISENPVTPTDEQLKNLVVRYPSARNGMYFSSLSWYFPEWQKIMFVVAPYSEVPEAVKDLFWEDDEYEYKNDEVNKRIIEAYKRGQKSMTEKCDIPPDGWICTRGKGHDGPCAAKPEND